MNIHHIVRETALWGSPAQDCRVIRETVCSHRHVKKVNPFRIISLKKKVEETVRAEIASNPF